MLTQHFASPDQFNRILNEAIKLGIDLKPYFPEPLSYYRDGFGGLITVNYGSNRLITLSRNEHAYLTDLGEQFVPVFSLIIEKLSDRISKAEFDRSIVIVNDMTRIMERIEEIE